MACDRPQTNETPKLPSIPEVVWQQPTETITNQVKLNITNNDSMIHYTQEKTTIASQTLPPNGRQTQNYVVTTERPPGNQIGNEPVSFLNCSKICPTNNQNTEQHVTTTLD